MKDPLNQYQYSIHHQSSDLIVLSDFMNVFRTTVTLHYYYYIALIDPPYLNLVY